MRLTVRASLIVDNIGVVGALIGDSLNEAVATFPEAIAEVT